ncbi:MAG: asparagine synthase [Rhizobacter sp.]|nr:asparagine synthase [Rhizobacter sp.]
MRIEIDFSRGDSARLNARVDLGRGQRADAGACTLVLMGRPRDSKTGAALDANALLVRYRLTGSNLAAGLHGNYAIAVVDVDKMQVVLLNDRMAVHSWCYAQSDAHWRIAPRADDIADGAELDAQALFTYLFDHVIPSPDTIYRGVKRLPPAQCMVIDAAGCRMHSHWEPTFVEPTHPGFETLRDEFRDLIRTAVKREVAQHAGDAIGTFLSGGTDSSTVTGTLRQVTGQPIRAYSIGFQADGYDEMEFASLAAKRFGVDHRQHYLTPEEVCDGIPKVATHYDQPFGNSSAVAAYHCARVAREEGCTHLLAGDGGDELFGGNARYAKQRVFGFYDAVPQAMRRLLMNPLLADNAFVARIPVASKAASYVQQARVPMPDRLSMYNLLHRIGLNQMLTPAFLSQVDVDYPLAQHRSEYAKTRDDNLINRMLAFDWKFTLADNDLPKVCGTASMAGISVGFPLLSDEMIDFSLKLPAHYKLNGLKLRWFFKEALRGFLPDEILTKKKQGFGLPFGMWALQNTNLSKLTDDALSSFGTRGLVQPAFIAKLRQELLPAHPGYYGELVWILVTLEFWLRAKRPDFRLDRN